MSQKDILAHRRVSIDVELLGLEYEISHRNVP